MQNKKLMWKWMLLLVLTAGSLYLVIPPKEKIPLGLDLKGGMSFTVGIDVDYVKQQITTQEKDLKPDEVQARVDQVLKGAHEIIPEILRSRIDNKGISEPSIFPASGNRVIIQLPGIDQATRDDAKKLIFSVAFLQFRMLHADNEELIAKIFQNKEAPAGYLISPTTPYRYIRDPEVKEVNEEELSNFHLIDVGPNYEFMLMKEQKRDSTAVFEPCFVDRSPELTGDFLESTRVNYPDTGSLMPTVGLNFNDSGREQFGVVTESYAPRGSRNQDSDVGRRMGIVLDGTLYSAPTINVPILDGAAIIEGSFTTSEAEHLVNVLQAGALPAPLIPLGETFVDPTLGADSIKSGIKSGVIGAAGVLVFMLVYYMFNGMIANASLVMNVILMPIGMVVAAGFLAALAKMFGQGGLGGANDLSLPVLTLPGIAGIFLSIGMAVDANVLILERIREELRNGKTLFTAIRAGYDRAFVTIVDANLTTLVTGIALFIFGSGPIRGYAVTLCGGILVSMYTGIYVTRLIYESIAAKGGTVSLKMLQCIGKTSVDFISKKKIAVVFSLALIVLTWGWMGYKSSRSVNSVMGIDFTGGASVALSFAQKADVSDVREALKAEGVKDPHVGYEKDAQGGELLKIRVGGSTGAASKKTPGMVVQEALQKHLASAGFKSVQEEDVGPQVGGELKKKALWAAFYSILGIIIYLSVRFEFGFALGAIVAVMHDVMVAVGIYVLLDKQINLTIIAALLTIIGYSVNDTIVIFDRIREDLRANRGKTFKEVCNQSINATLSRTILTTGATLFVVVSMMVFGGGEVREFATVLFIGMIAGTYSTIFIATPVVLAWYRNVMPALANKKTL